jgi:hypothetical protein
MSDPPVARVGDRVITRNALLAATRAQSESKTVPFDRASPEVQFNYATTVLLRMVDDLVCEDRADAATRMRARERAERTLARQPGADPMLVEGLYHYHIYRELTGHPPGGPDEAGIRRQWRDAARVEWLLRYDMVVTPKGRPASLPAVLVVGALAGGLWWRFGRRNTVLGVGLALRIAAWAAIPYDYLAYDVDGHLEYIRYVREHGRIPPADAGFQFYQPPVYYFLTAVAGSEPRAVQTVSLVLSVATLVAGLAVVPSGIGAWLLALHPALVLPAARINNDVLVTFWLFLAAAFLWRFWQSNRLADGWLAIAATLAGIWTKTTALLMAPVLAGVSLAHRHRWWLLPGVLLIALARPAGLGAGNVAAISPALALDIRWTDLLVFNPVRVVTEPFVNPLIPGPARDHLWEYWVRSALFGEFSFSWPTGLAGALVAGWLVVLGAAAWGVFRTPWRAALPMLLLLVGSLAGQAWYVWRAPFATSQDFRYLVVVLLPVAFFCNAAFNRGSCHSRGNASKQRAARWTSPTTR